MAYPCCASLSHSVIEAARSTGVQVHPRGTYVVIEGPQFSTRAESLLYKSWEADVVGMTALPEARLAREAEICYALIACVTDYDCWRETAVPVSVEEVVRTLNQNVTVARQIVRQLVPRLAENRDCECAHALNNAIITDPATIPREVKTRFALLTGKYLK